MAFGRGLTFADLVTKLISGTPCGHVEGYSSESLGSVHVGEWEVFLAQAKLEDSGSRASDLARQMLRLQVSLLPLHSLVVMPF